MIELISAFSLKQIIIFTVLVVGAGRGIIDVIQWLLDLYRKQFNKDFIKKTSQINLEEHYERCVRQHSETIQNYQKIEKQLEEITDTMNSNFKKLRKAEMHDINWWIKQQHKKHMKEGSISVEELEFIEKRFEDYTKLGGNSTIPPLMEDLRKLPKKIN